MCATMKAPRGLKSLTTDFHNGTTSSSEYATSDATTTSKVARKCGGSGSPHHKTSPVNVKAVRLMSVFRAAVAWNRVKLVSLPSVTRTRVGAQCILTATPRSPMPAPSSTTSLPTASHSDKPDAQSSRSRCKCMQKSSQAPQSLTPKGVRSRKSPTRVPCCSAHSDPYFLKRSGELFGKVRDSSVSCQGRLTQTRNIFETMDLMAHTVNRDKSLAS
mmetsp:Transcript_14692/g.40465  ORF Transcript_14692/g.40465 Transcript_14692/m.40465 type:complete len:216 (+) Transcript_14692:284-931(+)